MANRIGQRTLEARRRQEENYRQMESLINTDRRTYQRANFEINTVQKIENRTKQQLFEEKKLEYERDLNNRRNKLADLYNYEMNMWKDMILSQIETPEDRKQRIMERAYALRDSREKQRQELVNQKYAQQWRDSCDDARTLDSKATTLFMNQERLRQIREKIDMKKQLSSQENDFLAEWTRQLEEIERREREKEENRLRIERETSEEVKKQIERNQKRKEEYYESKLREEQEELLRLRALIEKDEEEQRNKLIQAHQRGHEIALTNLENKYIKEQESRIEREQDLILLNYSLEKERNQIKYEENRNNAAREAALQYKKYLEEQMIKEAEDTFFADEVRKREEDRVFNEREAALKARDDARNYLMKLVHEGRQEQIKYKQNMLLKEKEDDKLLITKFQQDNLLGLKKDRENEETRRALARNNNEELLKQIELKKRREELERQEAYLADKEMKYREKIHQQRLAQQAGSVRLNYPLQKNNWYS